MQDCCLVLHLLIRSHLLLRIHILLQRLTSSSTPVHLVIGDLIACFPSVDFVFGSRCYEYFKPLRFLEFKHCCGLQRDVGKARVVVVTGVVVRCRACGLHHVLPVMGMSVHNVDPCAAAVCVVVALTWHETVGELGRAACCGRMSGLFVVYVYRRLQCMCTL